MVQSPGAIYKPHIEWLLVAIAMLGFASSVAIFAPGILTPDSADVMSQISAGKWNDWHSPLYTLIFQLTGPASRGPLGMLILNFGLLWGACMIFACASARRYGWRACWFFIIPIFPSTLFAPAFAWDISLHALVWLMVAALVFDRVFRDKDISPVVSILLIAAILIGVLLRKNGWFASIPLLLCALPCSMGIKRRLVVVALIFMVTPLVWSGAARILNVTASHPVDSIKILDLGAMSAITGVNLFPGVWTVDEDKRIIEECYSPTYRKRAQGNGWDIYAWGKCDFVLKSLAKQHFFGSSQLTITWVSAIARHPIAYLQARGGFFMSFIMSAKNLPMVSHSEVNQTLGWNFKNEAVIKRINDSLSRVAGSVIFKPVTWLVLMISLAIAGVSLGWRNRIIGNSILLLMSGAIWLLTYFNFGVAYDFRYAFWSVYVALIAVIIMLIEFMMSASRSGKSAVQMSR